MKKIDAQPANPSNEPNYTKQGVGMGRADSSNPPSRRAWLRRGVAVATPVLVSLASAPVYATNVCVLPSGYISAATFASRHPPGTLVCVTTGPSHWASLRDGSWPGDSSTKIFKDVFGDFESQGNNKLKVVLNGTSSPLAKYCIAAYLNARASTTNFPTQLTPAKIVEIYKSYHGGPFSSLLVVGWTETETVTWLQTLMSA